LWKSFTCSLIAAVVLRELNPAGTGKLVLFETHYGDVYNAGHYLVFIFLGVCGGLFGGVFCRANYIWSKHIRKFAIIKQHPVFELCLVAFFTALLQFPNPLIRQTGDLIIENLLVDCRIPSEAWICEREARADRSAYYLWLVGGALVKLLLTIITFGCKVPSGIIIPALDSGALVGRLVGQFVPSISPGIFGMVGAAAFLAGVSRMTVSLAVIIFELTGEVTYIPCNMCAILVAKWVADAISSESVYELSQHLLGHPFLDPDHAVTLVTLSQGDATVAELIPPPRTMAEIALHLGPERLIQRCVLEEKLEQLKARGLMDAGLVIVTEEQRCHGYLPQAELELLLRTPNGPDSFNFQDAELSRLVDRSPLTITAQAPLEYAVEMFGKLGLRYLVVLEEDTSKVVGVVIKKRLVDYLDRLRQGAV
jgi:chloride channel 3/4/5